VSEAAGPERSTPTYWCPFWADGPSCQCLPVASMSATMHTPPEGLLMLIDCDRCQVRGLACSDCVVSVLLGEPAHAAELDGAEQQAIDVLAEAGLVPPLRLVVSAGTDEEPGETPPLNLPGVRSAG
jgi:hypothetical protein